MGIKYSNIFKALLLFCLIVFTSGCKDDPKRHLELGEWYANKGLVEEAILEFKEVTRLYPTSLNKMNRDDFQSLSKAHYNLSLMYTKKRNPMRRTTKPEDVAGTISMLLRPEADFINCSIIYCDGGEHRSGTI